MSLKSFFAAALAAILLVTGPVSAQDKAPEGATILVISGAVKGAVPVSFDLAALEKIGKVALTTTTKWTEGPVAFEGVLMRDLLKAVGATGTEIQAVAINDYKVTVPIADFDKYDVILAYRRDGKPMAVREKGPLWIMYPFDQNPDIKTDLHYARCAWQVKLIEVR